MGQRVARRNGASMYECGLSELNAPLPRRIAGSAGWWRTVLAFTPIPLTGGLYGLEAIWTVNGDPLLRNALMVYTLLIGGVAALLSICVWQVYRDMSCETRCQAYVTEHLQPALVIAGVLATSEQARALLACQEVDLDPAENLYGANSMRLVELPGGGQAIQFEAIY